MKVAGSVALVTGGASGLGLATVKELLAGGGKVMIVDRPQSDGAAVAKEIGAAFSPADVTNEGEVQAAVDETLNHFGAVHVNVNCAGTGAAMKTTGKAGPMPLEIFAKVIEINLIGTFNVLRLCATAMMKNTPNEDGERGVIINTASVAAYDGQIGQAAYSASKAGVVGMTLPIARDLSAVGIRVNTIAPGLIDTPIYGQGEGSEAFKDNLKKGVLFPKRLGAPEELASMVVELLGNSYMNAETIRVDGGIRMPPK